MRPTGNDLGNLFLVDDLLDHVFLFFILRRLADFPLQRRNRVILQLRRFLITRFVLCLREVQAGFFQLLLVNLGFVQLMLFLLPLVVFDFFFFFQIHQFPAQLLQPLQRLGVSFLFQRRFFNFQLHDPPHQLVQLRRHRIHLHPQ